MEQAESKIKETIVTCQKFRKLVDSIVQDWYRISGWTKIIDISEDETISINSKIVKGRTFPNCNHKGRIAEFKKKSEPFHKGIPISEDN